MQTLTRDLCRDNLASLIAVSADVSSWGEAEFMSNLPDKWDLSFIAPDLKGYAILSRKFPGRVHIHQFMVAPAFRRSGLGRDMLAEARRRNDALLSLKVAKDNHGAIRFYEREGLRIEKESGDYWWMVDLHKLKAE